ncbi:hypothetical protein LCGC14_1286640 [marine sediment metagenome]|uniref:Bacteriophage Mu GpT domain-containing protein n=1 Tax=marine sediment metagenome TaxID=412755 RepID=A0A0F9NWM8_9ZZZZ
MALQFADVDDAVLLTQQHLVKRGAFTDLQTDLQDHVLVRELWKGRKKVFSGGDPWEFEAQIDHNYSAKFVGLFETDGSALTDTMIKGTVNARHLNAHYIYDQREPAFQKGGVAIVNLVKTRYVAMMVSWFELLEATLWQQPEDDNKTPFGIAYWVTRSGSEGFNGGNPSNFSSGKAGISFGDQPRWANWTNQYVSVSKEDLIRKMRRAHRRTKFRSPVSHATPTLGGMKNGIYTNDDVIGLMEEQLEDQNMNLGNDLASKDGRAMFKSTPITYVSFLNDDSQDPVYMLDWKTLALGVLSGWQNQLSAPYMVPSKSKVRRVDLDSTLQMICTDLRRQAVISTA